MEIKLIVRDTTDNKFIGNVISVDDIHDLTLYSIIFDNDFNEVNEHDNHIYVIGSNYTVKLARV